MIDSGLAPKATSDDSPILLLDPSPDPMNLLQVTLEINTTGCFVSPNGGANWIRIPPRCLAITLDVEMRNVAVLLKRTPGLTNPTDIHANARFFTSRTRFN